MVDAVKLVHYLVPELSLAAHPARSIWKQNEKNAFLTVVRLLLAFGIGGSIAHYHFVDPTLSASGPLWFYYRYGIAALYAVVLLIYCSPRVQHARWYQIPWCLAGLLTAYWQAQTVVWAKDVPDYDPTAAMLTALAFATVLAVSMRKNIPATLCIAGAVMYVQWPALSAVGYRQGDLVGLAMLTLLFAIMSRAKMVSEIAVLISRANAIRLEKEAIESQMALYQQIKALLPQEIFERIRRFQQTRRVTALEAMDEVLRPQSRLVACIYSDIRSSTKRAKQEEDFVLKGMLPNTKNCTEVVEHYHGIPRLIGDLILTYFDQEQAEDNIILALKAAKDLVEVNRKQNALSSEYTYIERYTIVTFGQAVVGNLGGTNSSVEITSLGDPVNLGARIDALTKEAKFRGYLQLDCIVLSKDAAHVAQHVMPDLDIKCLDLAALDLCIRDYEDDDEICLIYLNDSNTHVIEASPLSVIPIDDRRLPDATALAQVS